MTLLVVSIGYIIVGDFPSVLKVTKKHRHSSKISRSHLYLLLLKLET